MSGINTNIEAIAGARSLNHNQEMLGRSLTRLSSGSKIVNPSVDAAGLAVSAKLDAQSRRVKVATTNVQNAISYIQTADGYMSGMTKHLTRLSELAILANSQTKGSSEVALHQEEFAELQDQLRATVGGTTAEIGGATDVDAPFGAFNGIVLFGSSATGGLNVAIGQAVGEEMKIGDTNLRTGGMLAIIQQNGSGVYSLESTDTDAIQKIADAIEHVATQRASLGAAQSRLELASTTLSVESENLSSAISRIRDVDVAEESTQLAKFNILVQSGTAMLAQANQTPKAVLQLLQN
jgi:flagellin